MFVGHLGTAFVAKRISPTTSLVWFVLAANLVDLLLRRVRVFEREEFAV